MLTGRPAMSDQNKNKFRGGLAIAMLCGAFLIAPTGISSRATFAQQAPPANAPAQPAAGTVNDLIVNANGAQIKLKVNNTTVVKTTRPYKRVSIGQPEIADFNPIAPTSILL